MNRYIEKQENNQGCKYGIYVALKAFKNKSKIIQYYLYEYDRIMDRAWRDFPVVFVFNVKLVTDGFGRCEGYPELWERIYRLFVVSSSRWHSQYIDMRGRFLSGQTKR